MQGLDTGKELSVGVLTQLERLHTPHQLMEMRDYFKVPVLTRCRPSRCKHSQVPAFPAIVLQCSMTRTIIVIVITVITHRMGAE